MAQSSYSDAELLEISRGQKRIIWLILLEILFIVTLFAVPALLGLRFVFFPVFAVAAVVLVYKLAQALRLFAVGYAIGSILPYLSLITMGILSDKASKVLKARGIRVGFLGVSDEELLKLQG